MAKYFYCDNGEKKPTSITMTQGLPQFRFFSVGDIQVKETYTILTFTASVAPTEKIKINYSFEIRNNYNGGIYTDWITTYGSVFLLAGNTEATKEVKLEREECESFDNFDGGAGGLL